MSEEGKMKKEIADVLFRWSALWVIVFVIASNIRPDDFNSSAFAIILIPFVYCLFYN